jgi:hypothetical protein
MSSAYDTLSAWARRTTTTFAELLAGRSEREEREPQAGADAIYRLRNWPHLPNGQKTAAIYRTLSVMSHRPVNRRWILVSTKLRPEQVDRLLTSLIEQGAVEIIDRAQLSGPAV